MLRQSQLGHRTWLAGSIETYDDAVHDFDWPGDALHTIVSPSGKVAHYGVDEEARSDALVRVREFLDAHLKP